MAKLEKILLGICFAGLLASETDLKVQNYRNSRNEKGFEGLSMVGKPTYLLALTSGIFCLAAYSLNANNGRKTPRVYHPSK